MKPSKTLFSAVLTAGVLLSSNAYADGIEIENPWSRASAGRAGTGAVFMEIRNSGDTRDRLVAASTPVAANVELHNHIREGDVMKMRPVEAVEIPAHGSATLKPGSYHVMLFGLHAPLKRGESFPVSLTFERSGTVQVEVSIQAAGAMGGPSGNMSGHGHGEMEKKDEGMHGHGHNSGGMKHKH